MRLILLGIVAAAMAVAQPLAQPVRFVTSDPSGACTVGVALQYNTSNGSLWGCNAGTWAAISGGGGGTFDTIGSGTNLNSLVMGSGGSLTYTGTGTIDARTLAGTTPTAFGLSLIDDADATTARATMGSVIGTNVQAFDADLSALAGLASAADKCPYFTGVATAAVTDCVAYGRGLLAYASEAAFKAGVNLEPGVDVEFPLTAGIGIGRTSNDLSLDLSELTANQTIFTGASASRTITFNLSGTDPVLTASSAAFGMSGCLNIGTGGSDCVTLNNQFYMGSSTSIAAASLDGATGQQSLWFFREAGVRRAANYYDPAGGASGVWILSRYNDAEAEIPTMVLHRATGNITLGTTDNGYRLDVQSAGANGRCQGCYSISGSSSIDFASINDGACAVNTFSLTGAATTDYLYTLTPAVSDGVDVTMRVSAADTVQVKVCNLSGSAYDPAALTFGARINR